MVAALFAVTWAPVQANHSGNDLTSTYLNPTPQSCVVGTPCTLDLLIHEPAFGTQTGVTAIDGQVTFDPTILQVTSVTGQFWGVDALTLNNTLGSIKYTASGSTVSNNTVVVATITFNPIAAGTSALSFQGTNIFYIGFGYYGSNGLAVNGSVIVSNPVVVYTSGSHVDTWDEIVPASAYSYWPDLCIPVPAVGLDANWVNPHKAFSFGTGAHPWQGQTWTGFSANWINAWSNLSSRGPGGHNWTKYSTEVTGTGAFVLDLLADNCSWIYMDGTLVAFQSYDVVPPLENIPGGPDRNPHS